MLDVFVLFWSACGVDRPLPSSGMDAVALIALRFTHIDNREHMQARVVFLCVSVLRLQLAHVPRHA